MYVVFDIGGTNIRLASSTDCGSLGEPVIAPTPADYNTALEKFCALAKTVTGGKHVIAIAGGLPGPYDAQKKSFTALPNLPGWHGKPFAKDVEARLKAPVFLENDAALVGLGEANAGAGVGFSIVAYLTVSTGVGGARIVNGVLDERAVGFEPGKEIIDPDQSLVPDAAGPTLEHYIGGRFVEKRTGKKPYEIIDPLFWDRMAYFLALGLNNILVHWSPDVVVLGGSMMKEIGIPIPTVEKYLKEICKIYPTLPPVKKAALGDFGGLHGALSFLKQQLK